MKWLVGIIVFIILLGGVYVVAKPKPAGAPKNSVIEKQSIPKSPTPSESQAASPSASAAVQEVTVTGNEFKFDPSTLTLKKGQPVKLTFKNAGNAPHNLTIADLDVRTKTIRGGEEDTVEFTPDKTGTFSYVCTVGNHAEQGMKGTATVQ